MQIQTQNIYNNNQNIAQNNNFQNIQDKQQQQINQNYLPPIAIAANNVNIINQQQSVNSPIQQQQYQNQISMGNNMNQDFQNSQNLGSQNSSPVYLRKGFHIKNNSNNNRNYDILSGIQRKNQFNSFQGSPQQQQNQANKSQNDYHMYNHNYYNKYGPQNYPKQQTISYEFPKMPKDFNPHYTMGQNGIDSQTFDIQNQQSINNKNTLIPQQQNSNNNQKFKPYQTEIIQPQQQNNQYQSQNQYNNLTKRSSLQQEQRPTFQNSRYNSDNGNMNLNYQYKKNQMIEQENIKKYGQTSGKPDILTNLFESNNQSNSIINYRSIDYDPITFSKQPVDQKRIRGNIYEQQGDFQSPQQNENQRTNFKKGGVLSKYLDDLKVSSIQPNPIYNERYQMGSLDFKNRKGEFTELFNNNCKQQQVFGRHFRKFK